MGNTFKKAGRNEPKKTTTTKHNDKKNDDFDHEQRDMKNIPKDHHLLHPEREIMPIPRIPRMEGQTQKDILLEHLKAIPLGAESQNQVKMIRLIHKKKFCQVPIIQQYLLRLLDLMKDFKVTGTYNDNIYSDYFSAGLMPDANEIIIPKKLMSAWDEGEAIDAGVPADELYEEFKPRKIKEFRQLCKQEDYRNELESLLFWNKDDNNSDSFCELFALENCPSFTFISHRWASHGKALGKHHELLLLLGLAKEEWLWLDCCCVPQDQESFHAGHTMKLIWNIDNYLSYAANMATYYSIDGIDTELYEKYGKASDGLLYLFHLLHPTVYQLSVRKMILTSHFNHSSRVWCSLERRLGEKMILQPKDYDVDQLFSLLNITKPDAGNRSHGDRNDPEDDGDSLADLDEDHCYDDLNNYEIAIMRLENLHSRYLCSLDCFSNEDIEPVTTLLYQHHTLPMVIHGHWPKYLDLATNQLRYGIRLPNPATGALCGWYYYDGDQEESVHCDRLRHDGGGGGATELFRKAHQKYFFICDWPNSGHEQIERIQLQIHKSCLDAHRQAGKDLVFQYHPAEDARILNSPIDDAIDIQESCLLCRR